MAIDQITSQVIMHDTERYYTERFPLQMAKFARSLERYGLLSFSRYVSKTNEDWNLFLAEKVSPKEHVDRYELLISRSDLYFDVTGNRVDHLASVPREDLPNFLCALFYTLLTDQVMYCHHWKFYEAFRLKTRYPKMLVNTDLNPFHRFTAKPCSVFSDKVIHPREIDQQILEQHYSDWSKFIVFDLRRFFPRKQISHLAGRRFEIRCSPILTALRGR